MRRYAWPLVALFVLTVLPSGGAVPYLDPDDAGTGADAPDGPQGAIPISAGQVYTGGITLLDVTDWYTFEGVAGSEVQFSAAVDTRVCVQVRTVEGTIRKNMCLDRNADMSAVTLDKNGTWYLVVTNSFRAPAEYRFAFAIDDAGPRLSPGPLYVGQNDAGSGRDAREGVLTDVDIEPGRVYQGNVTAVYGLLDRSDWYRFDGQVGDRIFAQGQGTFGCLRLHDPAGVRLAQWCAGGYVGDVQFGPVELESNGTHFIAYRAWSPDSYWFVFDIDRVPDPPYIPLEVNILSNDRWSGPVHDPIDQDHHAVVAFLDTGIDPYHATFRDDSPQAYQYPGTYIPGYPADAIALNITLDAPDFATAYAQDCETIWKDVEPGRLYWFPGTKIVGAVYLLPTHDATDCTKSRPVVRGILDQNGHGTMVASRGASFEYGACKECRIVAVGWPGTASLGERDTTIELDWLAANTDWIDVESHSWGPVTPVPMPEGAPGGLLGADPALVRAAEAAARAHLAFWASGNGVAFRLGVLGHPTLLAPHLAPSAVIVGGHDSGYVNLWPGQTPHVISDSCASWAAWHQTWDRSSSTRGGGTSGATPFAAGGAARILLEARRILVDRTTGVHDGVAARGTPPPGLTAGPLADGVFTLEEWRALVLKTASERPERQAEDGETCTLGYTISAATPTRWTDVPDTYPEHVQIGYGAVDRTSMDIAFDVLAGTIDLPARPEADAWAAMDHEVRSAWYTLYAEGLGGDDP